MFRLFLVSAATIGFEIALTRAFAVATWSAYGYWVISIVLAGFAISGVVLALAETWFERHLRAALAWLPAGIILAIGFGAFTADLDPFNPLRLQNPVTFGNEFLNILLYYACLLPAFVLAGLFVGLSFIAAPGRLGRVYAADLLGAGCGALGILAAMYRVPPFFLPLVLLVPVAFAARGRLPAFAAGAALLAAGAPLLFANPGGFSEFKAIYAPLHVPGSQVTQSWASPRGLFMVLNDFTERVDIDVSNNAAMLGLSGPPRAPGLYRDGDRIATLVPAQGAKLGFAPSELAALPYGLIAHPRVLLIGASGGWHSLEARKLGATSITTVETNPVLRRAARRNGPELGPVSGASPVAVARQEAWDIIDIAADFLDADPPNASAFAAEAMATYLRHLTPGGILSIPVSIREFPSYTLKVLATAQLALREAGMTDPAAHLLVYRSAWNARVLVSSTPFTPAQIKVAQAFCDNFSFDISYYQGMNVVAARANLYNDLPPVSFQSGQVDSGGGLQDAIADEAPAILAGQPTDSGRAFDLSPITLDRPFYYDVLRLGQLGLILKRIELLPQAELGPLVNLAVLAQAAVIALIVLALPLLAGRRLRAAGTGRAAVYFSALGLGFLFVELVLIQYASVYLDDATLGFAVILAGMLISAGMGSLASGRIQRPRRAMWIAVIGVLAWLLVLRLGAWPAMLATLDWALPLRVVLVLLAAAPVAFAMGMPFPLGLGRMGRGPFLPWAWALNGAFSVVATPLANLLAVQHGFSLVLGAAGLMYAVAALCFPHPRSAS
ncbi:spermidine synthase family protein [Acidisoma sp. 7E03]